MSLETIIKENLPALPELVKLLKEKFSTTPEPKTFKSDNGELIHNGELAVGVEVFLMEADKKVPAPTKTYKHEDGTEVVVEAGKVVDLKKPTPTDTKVDMKAFAEELFKAFPKTDLTAIERSIEEFKTSLSEASELNKALKVKVDTLENFKTEVISILEKFSAQPSAKPVAPKKTNSSKSIFNAEMTFEERVAILQNEQK